MGDFFRQKQQRWQRSARSCRNSRRSPSAQASQIAILDGGNDAAREDLRCCNVICARSLHRWSGGGVVHKRRPGYIADAIKIAAAMYGLSATSASTRASGRNSSHPPQIDWGSEMNTFVTSLQFVVLVRLYGELTRRIKSTFPGNRSTRNDLCLHPCQHVEGFQPARLDDALFWLARRCRGLIIRELVQMDAYSSRHDRGRRICNEAVRTLRS